MLGEQMAVLNSQFTSQLTSQLTSQVPAKRLRIVRWRDLRLWVGLAIMVVARRLI